MPLSAVISRRLKKHRIFPYFVSTALFFQDISFSLAWSIGLDMSFLRMNKFVKSLQHLIPPEPRY